MQKSSGKIALAVAFKQSFLWLVPEVVNSKKLKRYRRQNRITFPIPFTIMNMDKHSR